MGISCAAKYSQTCILQSSAGSQKELPYHSTDYSDCAQELADNACMCVSICQKNINKSITCLDLPTSHVFNTQEMVCHTTGACTCPIYIVGYICMHIILMYWL